jgi:hypothetical protein
MTAERLGELRQAAERARDWTRKRNRLIGEAQARGLSLRTIGEAAGLSHGAVWKITGQGKATQEANEGNAE